MKSKKLNLIVALSILLSGISHMIEGILSLEFLVISVTSFIYSFFFLPLGVLYLRDIIYDKLNNKKRKIIFSNVIILLNGLANFILLITENIGNNFMLPIFMIFHIIIALYTFPIIFYIKTRLGEMDLVHKLSYFSILLIKGLGLNYLFQPLAWILPEPNYITIFYFIIFGAINSVLGEKLYLDQNNQKIQIFVIIITILSGFFCVILVILYPNPNLFLFILFHIIILIIRIIFFKNSK